MGYTEEQIHTMEIINYTCAGLSVIGSLIIIISYLIYSKLRSQFAYSLVFFLAVADLMRSIGKLWGSTLSADHEDAAQCSIAGVITNFGGISSFVFVAIIAIVMYSAVNMQYASFWSVKPNVLKRRAYIIAVCVWSVTFLLSLTPFTQNAYGYVGAWCWIENEHPHWRWLCFYGPLICIFFFCIAVYLIVTRHLQKVEEAVPEKNRGQYQMFMNLKYYPLVLLIAFLFPTIRRVYQMFADEAPFWLGVCHTFGAGLYGGLNAVVYGINRSLKREVKKTIHNSIGSIHSGEMKVSKAISIAPTGNKYSSEQVQSTIDSTVSPSASVQ